MNTLATLEKLSKDIETAQAERAAQLAVITAKKEPYLQTLASAEKTVTAALADSDPETFETAQRKISSAKDAIELIEESLKKLNESTLFDLATYRGYCEEIKQALQADTDEAADKIREHLKAIDALSAENWELIQKGNEALANLQHNIMHDPETWTSATGVKMLLVTDEQKFTAYNVAAFPNIYKYSDLYNKG